MAKKDLKKKEAIQLIEQKLAKGLKKRLILEELSEEYMDRSAIEKFVAMTIGEETKNKYRSLNILLVILLITVGIPKLILGIVILSEISVYATLIALFLPVINIIFAVEIYKFRGYAYKIVGFLGIFSIVKNINYIFTNGLWGLIEFLLVTTIIVLAFYLGSKMFPNYTITGHKKDASDNWIFDDDHLE